MANINIRVKNGQNSLSSTYKTVVLKGNVEGQKNVLTQAMLADESTKYVIRWDFDLDNKSITVPSNCIIEFDGGSLSNGTLVGQDTILEGNFYGNVVLSGTFDDETFNSLVNKIANINIEIGRNDVPQTIKGRIKGLEDAKTTTGDTLPANGFVGQMFFYTPDGGTAVPVWYNGSEWVDATGASVEESQE